MCRIVADAVDRGAVARAAQARACHQKTEDGEARPPPAVKLTPEERRSARKRSRQQARNAAAAAQREREAQLAARPRAAAAAEPARRRRVTDGRRRRAEAPAPTSSAEHAATRDCRDQESDRWLRYSAKDVAALRKATGAGMLDCKTGARGDRRRPRGGHGLAAREGPRPKAGKLATARPPRARSTSLVDGNVGAHRRAELQHRLRGQGCRLHGDRARRLAKLVARRGRRRCRRAAVRGRDGRRARCTQLAAKLGENVSLGRVVVFETSDGLLDGYTHTQNDRGTIGVLVELGGVDPADAQGAGSRARDLAAHRRSRRPRTSPRRRPRRRGRSRAGGHRGEEPQRGRARGQLAECDQGSARTGSTRTSSLLEQAR